jgi:hypothetical protein
LELAQGGMIPPAATTKWFWLLVLTAASLYNRYKGLGAVHTVFTFRLLCYTTPVLLYIFDFYSRSDHFYLVCIMPTLPGRTAKKWGFFCPELARALTSIL